MPLRADEGATAESHAEGGNLVGLGGSIVLGPNGMPGMQGCRTAGGVDFDFVQWHPKSNL
ncbi:MAG: hypothetical protein U5J83_13165 [Bryobacterales bacterium]|nr:hypothetical protein [Bryobacterales bacterium]